MNLSLSEIDAQLEALGPEVAALDHLLRQYGVANLDLQAADDALDALDALSGEGSLEDGLDLADDDADTEELELSDEDGTAPPERDAKGAASAGGVQAVEVGLQVKATTWPRTEPAQDPPPAAPSATLSDMVVPPRASASHDTLREVGGPRRQRGRSGERRAGRTPPIDLAEEFSAPYRRAHPESGAMDPERWFNGPEPDEMSEPLDPALLASHAPAPQPRTMGRFSQARPGPATGPPPVPATFRPVGPRSPAGTISPGGAAWVQPVPASVPRRLGRSAAPPVPWRVSGKPSSPPPREAGEGLDVIDGAELIELDDD